MHERESRTRVTTSVLAPSVVLPDHQVSQDEVIRCSARSLAARGPARRRSAAADHSTAPRYRCRPVDHSRQSSSSAAVGRRATRSCAPCCGSLSGIYRLDPSVTQKPIDDGLYANRRVKLCGGGTPLAQCNYSAPPDEMFTVLRPSFVPTDST
jgi:hypothetical protein